MYIYIWELQDSPVAFEILTHCKTQIINMKRFIGNRLLACPLPSNTCHFSPSRACNSGCCSSATWILATENNHDLSRTPNTGTHQWAHELTTQSYLKCIFETMVNFVSFSLSLYGTADWPNWKYDHFKGNSFQTIQVGSNEVVIQREFILQKNWVNKNVCASE